MKIEDPDPRRVFFHPVGKGEARHAALLFGIRICVIHGGGKQLTELAEKLGVVQTVINGRRVTDDETLDLAKMIFKGKISTDI